MSEISKLDMLLQHALIQAKGLSRKQVECVHVWVREGAIIWCQTCQLQHAVWEYKKDRGELK